MEATRSAWNAKTPVRVFVVSQSVQALFFPYSQRGVFIRESRRELCGVGTRGTMVTASRHARSSADLVSEFRLNIYLRFERKVQIHKLRCELSTVEKTTVFHEIERDR